MPKWFALKKSGVHRTACFALYRALLRQQHQLPLSEQQRSALAKRIRKGFKKNAKIQSLSDVVAALRLGYTTLETLQKRASDWPDALTSALRPKAQKLGSLNPKSAPKLAESPNKSTTQSANSKSQPPRVWPYPDTTPVLSRPFQTISGRRRVPYLINANKVPFLLIKKPQPPFLGRIIRDSILTRERRLFRTRKIEDSLRYANDENSWDRILQRVCGVELDQVGPSWGIQTREIWVQLIRKTKEREERRLKLAQRMHEIVEAEKRLAEGEKRTRVEEKRMRYKERRQERRAQKELLAKNTASELDTVIVE